MLKIYGVPISVHTRKVIVTAIAKGVEFDNEPVVPFRPPPDWNQLSPTGKIPVATDGPLSLADSSVICTYLERVHPQPRLYPAEVREHVAALWFEEYADGTLFREVVHPLFFQIYIRPHMLEQQTDAAAVADTCQNAVPRVFGYLERNLEDVHFVGTTLSIADIAVASNLINYHYLGFTLDRARYPKLGEFFSHAIGTPALATALRAEQPVSEAMGLNREFLHDVPDR